MFHALGEEDLQRILAHPATMIASDGEVAIFGRSAIHARSYGTFARVLAVYVREKGVITLEDAVRKMSSFPAARIGLEDRGVLRPGMKADIAIFDLARVRDMATYDEPHQYAEGFAYVIVNGLIVYENGAMTTARPGKALIGILVHSEVCSLIRCRISGGAASWNQVQLSLPQNRLPLTSALGPGCVKTLYFIMIGVIPTL